LKGIEEIVVFPSGIGEAGAVVCAAFVGGFGGGVEGVGGGGGLECGG